MNAEDLSFSGINRDAGQPVAMETETSVWEHASDDSQPE